MIPLDEKYHIVLHQKHVLTDKCIFVSIVKEIRLHIVTLKVLHNTYVHPYIAVCSGKEWMKACDGPCPCSDWIKDPVVVYAPQPCGCDNSYSPVCATNGNTYQNECQANCK